VCCGANFWCAEYSCFRDDFRCNRGAYECYSMLAETVVDNICMFTDCDDVSNSTDCFVVVME